MTAASPARQAARATRLPEGLRLYRGLGGLRMPERFHRADPATGYRAMAEWGFMSTTADRDVAVQYTGVARGRPFPTLLEVRPAAVDHGADIGEYSQYPGEREYLWSPCSLLEPDGPERLEATPDGVVTIVPVRMNLNVRAMTVEELLGEKRRMHLAAFGYLVDEVRRELPRVAAQEGAEARLARDRTWKYEGTVQGLLDGVARQCDEVLARHRGVDAERYASDEVFRGLVVEMLEVRAMALSKLRRWLADETHVVAALATEALRRAHRSYVSHLRRTLPPADDPSRPARAAQLCRVRGLMQESVDERNDLGEVRLAAAAADGADADTLALLVAAGAGVDEAGGGTGWTAVSLAAQNGHAHTVAALHALGADLDLADACGAPPLYYAASGGHADAVRALLAGGAAVDAAERDGCTPLWIAAANGHVDVMRALLEARADAGWAGQQAGATPLFMAAQNGNLQAVDLLHENGAPVGAARRDGVPPICVAAQNGRVAVVRRLAALGADVNQATASGFTALMAAQREGQSETVRALLELGAIVDAGGGGGGGLGDMFAAARAGDVAAIRALHAAGAPVDPPSADGSTPLHEAARAGHAAAVELLVGLGAQVQPGSQREGCSPLWLAAAEGRHECCEALLRLGAAADAPNCNGAPPLYMAAQNGHAAAAAALLQAGASADAALPSGFTAMLAAAQGGHTAVVRALAAAGADVRRADSGGHWTPLVIARQMGHAETVEALLDLGA